MASDWNINLVLCWHMHQPDYCDHIRDQYAFPWTYLHGIKDYTDMAAHLEAAPDAKAVVNFSPILIEQLEHYVRRLQEWRSSGRPLPDPVLDSLQSVVWPTEAESRAALVKACMRANRLHLIDRFEPYRRLAQIADLVLGDVHCGAYLSDRFLADLVTWYHLAWLGETIRMSDPLVQQLIKQGTGFSLHQRRLLLQLICDRIGALGGRYRSLSEQGRIELSTSPWGHPMLPLLLNFKAAREAVADLPLPEYPAYPGGNERARWHLEEGLKTAERFFGTRPTGCWPSEGGVSAASLALLEQVGFQWAATGENVLRSSIGQSGGEAGAADAINSPWRLVGADLKLFARNDTLSDLIGFTYADWHADDAVADLIHRIEEIGKSQPGDSHPVVSIIMDGENAWEHYPRNGYYFLSTLYKRLGEHPRIRLTTYSELLGKTPTRELKTLVSGSWVYGTFSTWMGDKDKNRAWDILVETKQLYDQATAGVDPDRRERISRQLGVCEGSDWFWWLGDYNPEDSVSDFEHLYRIHITGLYTMLGLEPPQYLSEVLSHGEGAPARGGTMRHGTAPVN